MPLTKREVLNTWNFTDLGGRRKGEGERRRRGGGSWKEKGGRRRKEFENLR